MSENSPLRLGVRYLREVIGAHVLRPRRADASTYIHSSRQGNRYFYLTLRFLTGADRYGAVLTRKPWIVGLSTYTRRMDTYGRLVYRHPHAGFRRRIPRVTQDKIFVHDGQAPELVARDWGKIIRLEYDVSLAPPENGAWMVMPYPMHPLVYASDRDRDCRRLRAGPRSLRLFFAGNVDAQAYTSSSSMRAVRARFDMLDRARVISTLETGLGDAVQRVSDPAALNRCVAKGAGAEAVLAIDPGFRIGLDRWLETLSRCDVLLSPPGVFMPLCHNAVEAMSVGCIPLTNYAAWFTPRLTHMENCIEFTDEADLVRKARMVLEMDSSRIAEMRANVAAYYDRYLDPDRFRERVFAHPAKSLTLFVITERRSTWERVDADSVLLADRAQAVEAPPIVEAEAAAVPVW